MNKYEKFIDCSKYQVFLFCSKAVLPFSFSKHSWFVVNRLGSISRYEIIVDDNVDSFVRRDFCSPWLGSSVTLSNREHYFKEELVGYVTGDKGSFVDGMVGKIVNSVNDYPYKKVYKYLGPNCNTYTQWVLDSFPECNLRLPFNAFGKDYKKKP